MTTHCLDTGLITDPSVAPIATLIVTSLAVMGSPGPSTISLVACSAAYGLPASLRYCTGLITGTTVVLVAVAFGVTTLLLTIPGLSLVLLIAASLYIIWLAIHIAMAPPLERDQPRPRPPAMIEGLLLGVVNPKAWVALGAVFASSHLFDRVWVDGVVKTAILTMMVVIIHVCWMFAGGVFVKAFRDARRARAVNVVMAILLVASMGLALSQR